MLENNTAITFRTSPAPTSLAAAATAGDTNIKVNSTNGLAVGQTIVLENGTVNHELATIASVGTAGAAGTGVVLTAPLTKAHASGSQVNVTATDPTGDMTKVFGAGSSEWIEGRESQIAPPGTAARNARTDRLRRVSRSTAAPAAASATRTPRTRGPTCCPDEAGGYTGYQGLFGAKYVNPAINNGNACVNDTTGQPIDDPVRPVRASPASTGCSPGTRSARSRRCRRPASR